MVVGTVLHVAGLHVVGLHAAGRHAVGRHVAVALHDNLVLVAVGAVACSDRLSSRYTFVLHFVLSGMPIPTPGIILLRRV